MLLPVIQTSQHEQSAWKLNEKSEGWCMSVELGPREQSSGGKSSPQPRHAWVTLSLITESSFPRTDVPITAKIVSSFVMLDKHQSLLWILISETSGRSWTHSSFHQILRQGIESPFWPSNCPWEERTPYRPLRESHQHSKSCGLKKKPIWFCLSQIYLTLFSSWRKPVSCISLVNTVGNLARVLFYTILIFSFDWIWASLFNVFGHSGFSLVNVISR